MLKIQHDGTVEIATGRSRRETNWKNKEFQWADLVTKLSTTHRTAETYSEYISSKKPRQDEIKDIGGFVGGYLTGGRRKAGSVMHRQLITLDIDAGQPGLWDDFTLMYGCAAVIYSTHKHTPEAPRIRLIIPLDRPVMPDEYVAIGRRIAGEMGIEMFDNTGFQPERLMYWPSTSKDGEFEFQYQDGPWLCADTVLASYRDWRDSSEWPVSERSRNLVQRAIKKQGDPLEKPGIVGAFCRTYNIHEAIEAYLDDVYEECDVDGRYTYKEGSTAAGLITYDDKFAYSHHGTDPTSGKLCNAFDLVRLHLFGLKDEDAREDTPINKMPSYLAMAEHSTKDARVRKQLGAERLQSAQGDFENIEETEEDVEVNDEWMKDLDVDKKGNYTSSIDNIYKILKFDPNLRGRLVFDEFENRLIAVKNLPWRKVSKQTRDFSDDDSDCLAHYLECYQMPFTHIAKALSKIRNEFKTHPIRAYLEGLRWDGIQRLESLFIDYLGAEDSPYTRAATRKTFIAAVARVFKPGIKFDTVLTLIGKEGIGKSTIIRKMAKEWFSDCLGDVHTKDGMESLRGVWVMEIAELASFRSKDQDAIKRFITSCEDLYRPAYGKQQVRFPRQCVFFATTNKYDFLSGPHDHRRFLPIDTHVHPPTKNVFQHFTDEEINQAWAEALHYYRAGESLDLSDEVKILANKTREKHNEVDDRAGVIEQYLNTLLPENWANMKFTDRRDYIQGGGFITEENSGTELRTEVCVAEIWCELLGGFQKDMTNNNTKYIHDILKKMRGWQPMKKLKNFPLYGRQRGYERVNTRVNTSPKSIKVDNINVNTANTKANTN